MRTQISLWAWKITWYRFCLFKRGPGRVFFINKVSELLWHCLFNVCTEKHLLPVPLLNRSIGTCRNLYCEGFYCICTERDPTVPVLRGYSLAAGVELVGVGDVHLAGQPHLCLLGANSNIHKSPCYPDNTSALQIKPTLIFLKNVQISNRIFV